MDDDSQLKRDAKPGWRFAVPANRIACGANAVVEDLDIRDSLMILLTTSPGEFEMEPDFGCDLQRLVFDKPCAAILARLRDDITRAVTSFEPRISLRRITFELDSELEGCLYIRLDYTVIITNTNSNMVYPFNFLST